MNTFGNGDIFHESRRTSYCSQGILVCFPKFLCLHKVSIDSMLIEEQVLVATLFDNATILQYVDTIGILDGRKTMGNNDCRATCQSLRIYALSIEIGLPAEALSRAF